MPTQIQLTKWRLAVTASALLFALVLPALGAYVTLSQRVTRNESIVIITERIEKKLDTVQNKLDVLQTRVGELESRISKVEVKIDMLLKINEFDDTR